MLWEPNLKFPTWYISRKSRFASLSNVYVSKLATDAAPKYEKALPRYIMNRKSEYSNRNSDGILIGCGASSGLEHNLRGSDKLGIDPMRSDTNAASDYASPILATTFLLMNCFKNKFNICVVSDPPPPTPRLAGVWFVSGSVRTQRASTKCR